MIGNKTPAGNGKPDSWPMTLAYHDLSDQSEEPEFQLKFQLREDGVTDDLILNYGQFALHGTLDKLEPLPAPKCD